MSVSTLVLLGLAVVWAIVLLPEAMKRISKARSGDSIRSFNHHLSSLQRGNPHASTAPVRVAPGRVAQGRVAQGRVAQGRGNQRDGGRSSNVIDLRPGLARGSVAVGSRSVSPAEVHPAVRRRRQEVLTVLGSASVLTLLCSVAFGGPFLVLFLVSAALLVAYAVALFQVMSSPQTARNLHGSVDPLRPAHLDDLHGVRISAVSPRRVAN